MTSKQQDTKPQSVRPSDKKLLDEQASGAGKHSGRQHPPAQKVVDAKHDPAPQKAALSQRKASTYQNK